MDNLILKLRKYWEGFDLANYRPINGTYSLFLWSEVPPLLQKFSGTFDWLPKKVTDKQETLKKLHGRGAQKSQNFSKDLEALEKKFKITFPEDFKNLMQQDDWEDRLTFSPTACFFPNEIEVHPFLSGHITTIYRDQQDVVQWFLYFESDQKKCKESIVLASPAPLEEILKATPEQLMKMLEIGEISYESFIYRINLENMTWYTLHEDNFKVSRLWQAIIDQYLDFYDSKKWQKTFEEISEKDLSKKFKNFDPVVLVKYKKLSDAFLKEYADQLPWLYISHYQQLSDQIIEQFADKLDWQIMSVKQKLSLHILEKFSDRVDWPMASYYQQLTPELIEKNKDKVDWVEIFVGQKLPPEFYEKHEDKIHWQAISYSPYLPEVTLKKYADKLDWQLVSRFTPLSEKLIQAFADRLNWQTVAQYQKLSENLIRKYQDKLNWWLISSNQNLSEDFIEEHKYQLVWENLLKNPNVPDEFKKKNQHRPQEIANEIAAFSEEKIRKNIDTFNINLLYRYRELSEKFLQDFDSQIFWNTIAQFQPIPESLIRKHQNEVNWYFISLKQKLSEDFIKEFKHKINGSALQQNPHFSAELKVKYKNYPNELDQDLSEEELREKAKNFTPFEFSKLCETRQLSEKFLEDFADKINWATIARTQKLSENFIRKHQDKLNWWDVSGLPLSENFIREFKNKVEWKIIKQCQKNLSKEFLEEFKKKLK